MRWQLNGLVEYTQWCRYGGAGDADHTRVTPSWGQREEGRASVQTEHGGTPQALALLVFPLRLWLLSLLNTEARCPVSAFRNEHNYLGGAAHSYTKSSPDWWACVCARLPCSHSLMEGNIVFKYHYCVILICLCLYPWDGTPLTVVLNLFAMEKVTQNFGNFPCSTSKCCQATPKGPYHIWA